jgi:hypothetical protein
VALEAYLAKPSNENFFIYYNAYRDNASLGPITSPRDAINNPNALTHNAFHVERAKPSAGMYVAHVELQKALGLAPLTSRGMFATVQTSGPRANSREPNFVDAFGRMADNTQQQLGGPTVVPAAAIERMAPEIRANLAKHLRFKNMDWWGLAFTYQPAINSVAAAYWLDGWVVSNEKEMELFPSFRVFSLASRGIAENSFGFLGLIGPTPPQHFSTMHSSTVLAQTENPAFYFNADHMKLHQRMAINVYKMQFLLRVSDWQASAATGVRGVNVFDGRQANNPWLDVELIKSFAKRHMPDDVPGIDLLAIELAAAADRAYTGAATSRVATAGTGLTMEMFDDANFSVPLGAPQIVPGINVTNVRHHAPDVFFKNPTTKLAPRPASVPAVPTGAIPGSSVIWSGRIVANYDDSYQFIVPSRGFSALQDIRVTVDGNVVLAGGKFGNVGTNNFGPGNNGSEGYYSVPIPFAAGQSRTIKVEHSTTSDNGQFAALMWAGTKTMPRWLVQPANLYPN